MNAEIAQLSATWTTGHAARDRDLVDRVVPGPVVERLDRFDWVQLEEVLRVCRTAPSLSAAGRRLFDRSRERRTTANDADRLRKYLARFDLEWAGLKERLLRVRNIEGM